VDKEKEDKELDLKKEQVKKEFTGFFGSLKQFLKELLDIRLGADKERTAQDVKDAISMKGHTAWILIFSIFIASIGLNTNSTAVVIGAMLISPLMGPILGIGLSIGTNDIDTLKRSLVNFGIMVFLSVLTSFIYFAITPFTEVSNELLARTSPTLLDVIIAVFGGFALIIAISRPSPQTNTVAGVAIATALMPPLCTAGYGLAIGNMNYFVGALYLFTINTIFIALATYVVVKSLRFPMVKYANSLKRKRIARTASFIAFLVMLPSIYLFWNMYTETIYVQKATLVIQKIVKYKGSEIVKSSIDNKKKEIDIYMIGELVPDNVSVKWNKDINIDYPKLKGTKLIIHQGKDRSSELAQKLTDKVKSGILEDLYVNNQKKLQSKDEQISLLENEINKFKAVSIHFKEISKEIKINYENIEKLSFASQLVTDFKKIDTIPVFTVIWNKNITKSEMVKKENNLKHWLKMRLKLDTLQIKRN